jgi:hypothetical protein
MSCDVGSRFVLAVMACPRKVGVEVRRIGCSGEVEVVRIKSGYVCRCNLTQAGEEGADDDFFVTVTAATRTAFSLLFC